MHSNRWSAVRPQDVFWATSRPHRSTIYILSPLPAASPGRRQPVLIALPLCVARPGRPRKQGKRPTPPNSASRKFPAKTRGIRPPHSNGLLSGRGQVVGMGRERGIWRDTWMPDSTLICLMLAVPCPPPATIIAAVSLSDAAGVHEIHRKLPGDLPQTFHKASTGCP